MQVFGPSGAFFIVILSDRGEPRSAPEIAAPSRTSPDGCGLTLVIKMDAAGGGYIHLARDDWSVSRDACLGLAFDLDGEPITQVQFRGTGDAARIEGSLSPDQATSLVDHLSCGRQVAIRFLVGNDRSWAVPVQGTYRIVEACVHSAHAAQDPLRPLKRFRLE